MPQCSVLQGCKSLAVLAQLAQRSAKDAVACGALRSRRGSQRSTDVSNGWEAGFVQIRLRSVQVLLDH